MEAQVFGIPPDETINHGMRFYLLSVAFALVALVQWLLIGNFLDYKKLRVPPVRYGLWLGGTFFGICILAWTPFGRKFPFNFIITFVIVECSTIYMALEQMNTRGMLVNVYAGIIVVTLVITCVFWGAYLPMRLVPGDLMLSLLLMLANIMLAVFFINALFFNESYIYRIVRNFMAVVAVSMIMYTATIIHDRQFDVSKKEYLFLSVLIFFGHMILHERILNLAVQHVPHLTCKAIDI
ncbi:CG9483 [Drosophila busckii]|uniref:CG9483 n=1 Tax=Drosophila busckii TaxID=30019 RepID=A0A0M4E4T9_DROBS|nr:CG9483 [Drosophila busckii]